MQMSDQLYSNCATDMFRRRQALTDMVQEMGRHADLVPTDDEIVLFKPAPSHIFNHHHRRSSRAKYRRRRPCPIPFQVNPKADGMEYWNQPENLSDPSHCPQAPVSKSKPRTSPKESNTPCLRKPPLSRRSHSSAKLSMIET